MVQCIDYEAKKHGLVEFKELGMASDCGRRLMMPLYPLFAFTSDRMACFLRSTIMMIQSSGVLPHCGGCLEAGEKHGIQWNRDHVDQSLRRGGYLCPCTVFPCLRGLLQ
jgi:hypothetical protein